MPSRVPVGRDILSSSPFRRSLLIRCHRYHIADWATVFTALFLYMLLEHKEPFHRMFSLDDQTLQHPFTESERVPNVLCLVRLLDFETKDRTNYLIDSRHFYSIAVYLFHLIYERAGRGLASISCFNARFGYVYFV